MDILGNIYVAKYVYATGYAIKMHTTKMHNKTSHNETLALVPG